MYIGTTIRQDRQAKTVVAYSEGLVSLRLVYNGVAYIAAIPAKKSYSRVSNYYNYWKN